MCSCRPVAMCGWPPACTSGFTRIETEGHDATASHIARRFFQQNFQLRFRLDVEKQNPAALSPPRPAPRGDWIAQCLAHLLARLPNARKNDPIATHADSAAAFAVRRPKRCRIHFRLSRHASRSPDFHSISPRSTACAEANQARDATPPAHRQLRLGCKRKSACRSCPQHQPAARLRTRRIPLRAERFA